MNVSKLNDWLQLGAALGVIAGLGLVAYELRQEHDLVRAQLASEYLDATQELNRYFLDPTALRAYVKAHEAPETLTTEEQLVLHRFYGEVISTRLGRSAYMARQGIFELVNLEDVADTTARIIFSSRYGREWWERARVRGSAQPFIIDLLDDAAERYTGPSIFENAADIKNSLSDNAEE